MWVSISSTLASTFTIAASGIATQAFVYNSFLAFPFAPELKPVSSRKLFLLTNVYAHSQPV